MGILNKTEDTGLFTNHILPILVLALVLLVWEVFGQQGIISPAILPAPSRIITTFLSMLTVGDILEDIRVSLFRVCAGFFLGSFAGVVLGILIGLFHKIERSVSLIIGILRPIPMIALIPLFILWMGIGEASKIAIIFFGAFWPVLINTIYGIKGVEQKLIDVALILKKKRLDILVKIILPSALPSIFAGIRLGAGNAWACVVAAEMIAASSGVGYLVMYAREVSQANVMLVGITAIGILGLLIDFLIVRIESHLLFWQNEESE